MSPGEAPEEEELVYNPQQSRSGFLLATDAAWSPRSSDMQDPSDTNSGDMYSVGGDE